MSFRIDQLAVYNLATVGGSITAGSLVKSGGTSSQFLKADGSVDTNTYITGITSGMVTTALGYTPVPNTRTLTINGTTYDLTADRSWTISVPVSSVSGSGAGISVSPTTGAVVVSNTGVTSNVAGTGISVSGATGAVTITNTGVTSIVAGTAITVSGSTGAVTINNAGVTSLNGSTGALTGFATQSWVTSQGYITSASVGNGTLTLAVSGSGLSGSASFTANQSGATTFTVTSNATSANTASTIVFRDASGNFVASKITTTGLYGPSTSGNIGIWQYDASNTGYGIVYNEGSPDTLRIDVSGQALTGTPDVLIGPDYMQINGNTVLHAGNYNSYSPTLTGGGASGTWGINITGNAATTSQTNFSNLTIGGSQVWYNSGSWLGDLASYGFTRAWGLSMSGGSEFVVLYKGGQGYTLVDGSYYAYEGGGFYSSNNSAGNTLLGFYADTTSSVNFNTGTVKANGSTLATQSWVNSQGFLTGSYVPVSGGINMTGSYGLNDNKLYLRTNGDNNHYLWNAGDDWEELNAYEGTGFRITSVGGTVGVLYVYGSSNGGYTYSPYSFRAPIFYDSNNTGYYFDGDSGTNLNYLNVNGNWGGSPFGSSHAQLTITGSYASMYQTATNGSLGYWLTHVASDGTWNLYGGRGAVNGSSWDWSIRAWPNQDGSYVEFRTSARAPIFYDSQDTTYYVDPNSTSVMKGIDVRVGSVIQFYTSAGSLRGYINATDTDDNHLQIATSGGEDIVFKDGGLSGTRNLVIRGGNGGTEAYGSMRSPIFYDSQDTSYYLDPNSDSYLRSLYLGAHDSGSANFFFGEDSSSWYGMRWYWDSGYDFYWYGRNAGTDTLIMNYTTNSNSYVKWHRHFHMNGYNIDYVGSIYFNSGPATGYLLGNTGGSYGSLQINGAKNGWYGLNFESGNTLMMNANESGHHQQAVGWKWRWYNGQLYTSRGSTGGGTEYTVLDSGNYNSYAPTLTGTGASGTWGISITGNAATASNASQLGGWTVGQMVPYHSGSDFPNGTLVVTNINSSVTSGDSFVMEVTGKSYQTGNSPFGLLLQGYIYADTFINCSAMSYGTTFPNVVILNYGGNLAFWWPRISYWNSFSVTVRDAGGSSYNRVTSIGDSTEPSSSKKVTVSPFQVVHSGNIGSQSVNYASSAGNADTVDGYHASTSTIGNYIVVRDGNGYIFGNYINMTDDGNPGGGTSISSFITKQGDNYYRSVSPTNAMASIRGVASGSWGINITGSAASETLATVTGRGNVTSGSMAIGSGSISNGRLYVNSSSSLDVIAIQTTTTGAALVIADNTTPTWANAPRIVAVHNDFQIRTSATTRLTVSAGGSVTMAVDARAPIFYDSNDTAYYADFANSGVSIKTAGNVLIGQTYDPGNKLQVNGNIYAVGDVTAYSDIRVKTNIRSIERVVERIMNIRGVIYDRTDIESNDNIGFIAQELEEQFPELIHTNNDGTKGVKYQNMTAILVEVVKKQQKQIDELKARLD